MQELCDALAAQLRLIAALARQLGAGGNASASAAAASHGSGLLGLTTRYRRAVGALFATAAPVDVRGERRTSQTLRLLMQPLPCCGACQLAWDPRMLGSPSSGAAEASALDPDVAVHAYTQTMRTSRLSGTGDGSQVALALHRPAAAVL